jgi:hypothetical protein
MLHFMARKPLWLGGPWEVLAITVALFVLVAVFVDLKPVVDEIFSFRPAIQAFGSQKKSSNIFHHIRN